ncbi:porin [Phaeobacter marinintestinus]|uniref:porin n=1 Tax=Falsiphaeobacter marinintestinus TaxID=1492905 RepID=UPI0011B82589|nr:porin [Phaeobacter marinintestinus]
MLKRSYRTLRYVGSGMLMLAMAWPEPLLAFDDYTGPLGVTTRVYGQFSPSYLSVRDGGQVTRTLADNSNSVSRVGLILRRPFEVGEFQFRFETAMGFRESGKVSQLDRGDPFDWDESDIRFVDTAFQINKRGLFSFGHGSMATDQVASADLSGTKLANSVSVPDMAGGMFFRNTSGALSAIKVKSAFNTFDGVRRARLRYDFRARRGITLSVSAGAEILQDDNDEENFDVAATYIDTIGKFDIQGAVGGSITNQNNRRTRKDLVGSVSVLHKPTGISATVAGGQGSSGGLFTYAKIGLQRDWSQLGPTALSFDYHYGQDIVVNGSISQSWGVAVVQRLERQQIDVFFGYRGYALQGVGVSLQDVHAIQMGARWRF